MSTFLWDGEEMFERGVATGGRVRVGVGGEEGKFTEEKGVMVWTTPAGVACILPPPPQPLSRLAYLRHE